MTSLPPIEDVASPRAVVGKAGQRTLIFTAIIIAFAATIPIDSAVIANGKLTASGNNIDISHPSGGRVIKVHAQDGDRVRQGDPILEIDPSINQAELGGLAVRSAALKTERLTLEREIASITGLRLGLDSPLDESNQIDWDLKTASLGGSNPQPGLARNLAQQQTLGMQSRLDRMQAEREAIESRVIAQQSRLKLLRSQYKKLSGFRAEFEARGESVRNLLNSGHMSPVEALDFQMQALESIGRIENLQSEIADIEANLFELQSQLRQIKASSVERTQTRLAEVTRDAAAIEDGLKAAMIARDNSVVRAPADGIITGSIAQSPGIVVPSTQAFAVLVPSDQPLEFVGKVRPRDIASVVVGGQARLKISALNAKQVDNISATVVEVSADTKTDQRTGESHFEVRMTVEPDQDEALLQQVSIGMTGDAFILGESRTFLKYLMQPISAGFKSALREVR